MELRGLGVTTTISYSISADAAAVNLLHILFAYVNKMFCIEWSVKISAPDFINA